MTSEARELFPESESFLKEVIKTLQNSVVREMLHVLLTDDEDWERFLAEATLSREEAEALRELLNELQGAKDLEAEEQQGRERFLDKFPRLKAELEESIRKLHKCADDVDREHRDRTISNVVLSSATFVSGVLDNIRHILELYVPAEWLGAVSSVTELCSILVELCSESSAVDEANRLISSDTDEDEVFQKFRDRPRDSISSSGTDLRNELKELANKVRAIKEARGNPELAVQAQCLTTGLPVSGGTARRVQNTFRGTALAMTRGARIGSAVSSVHSLGSDVHDLVKDSGHLQEGAKAESAEDMRGQARELESKLEKLSEIDERLKEDPSP
ncbi:apolipoprotein L3-like [Meles meles]|uniref:apolipoprotein L3-like n=1 Tax=Meles meles TaxID=9662 RepID=UPI001E69C6E9|nr:apolipoprotein L3-like [Meles meles]